VKCDVTERSNISTDGGDVLQPRDLTAREDTESAKVGLGSKDGRSWGQCPLCPFVCPHPLVMRRHLDVHDEPELQRSTDRRPAARNFDAATESTSKTRVELGAAGTRSSLLDVTGNLNPYFDGAERASTSMAMFNCPTWSSTFSRGSDGHRAGSVSKLTDSIPSWLQDCPFPVYDLTSTAGQSASRNSTSVSMAKSAGQQTAPGQAVVPFTFGLQTPGNTEDSWRARDWQELYESSRHSERARCSKGGKKHAAKVLPAGGDVTTLTASATNTTTPPWWSMATPTGQWRVPLPPPTSTGTVDWLRGWASNEQLWSRFIGGFQTASDDSETAATAAVHSTPAAHQMLSAHMHGADFKVAFLRYCCTTVTYVGVMQIVVVVVVDKRNS